MSSNPFSALLGETSKEETKSKQLTLSDMIEEIFEFTIDPKKCESKGRLFLEELQKANSESADLSLTILNHALFDRLFMCNNENDSGSTSSHAYEFRVLIYLYKSYIKMNQVVHMKSEDKEVIDGMIMQNVATAILQPDIYFNQDLPSQFLQILKEADSFSQEFFVNACKRAIKEDGDSNDNLKKFLSLMLSLLTENIKKSTLISFDYGYFNVFYAFANDEYLSETLVKLSAPNRINIGSDYASTPFGALLNLSLLPKAPSAGHDYFQEPLNQASNAQTEGILWSNLNKLTQEIHSLFLSLLKKGSVVKRELLSWLGNCLKANLARGKIWSSQAPPELNPATYSSVTDGFMLNLNNVALRLCAPFCNFADGKVLKVDPTYCAVKKEECDQRGVHLTDLAEQTCLLPLDEENETRHVADSYNFITECFFISHRAIDLGFRVCVDKLIKMNQEMGRIERAFNDAVQQAGANNDLITPLRDRMTSELTKYLSLKCAVSDPNLTTYLFDFISSTCFWLVQVSAHIEYKSGFAPLTENQITFPLSDKVPSTLKCIPEFLIENIVSILSFIRRFNPKVFEEQGKDKMEPILSFILIFMGSNKRVRNPHLRARLAEALEAMLPYHNDDPPQFSSIEKYERKRLFSEHKFKGEIVESLLHVFVEIEMTGQSVEFEQKFNYRRPMYAVIEYLWEAEEHLEAFTRLAQYAEANMEAVNPPLFLRFVNHLINDAIFLLDEALGNMSTLRDMQQARDNGEWESLPPNERQQNLGYMYHIGMMGRFDNILGKDTINTLEKLTSKIQIVFTHSTMVDRIAAMLNYFLLHLVGPNKKNFKVKNPKEYSFNPADTVLTICKIYFNLKESEAFLLAVSRDGRSYSPELFEYAEEVLVRIGGGALVGEFKIIAEKVGKMAEEYKVNEEVLAEAPDHFLDPIMSTIMRDPVMLPSSKQIVDRTTIARHLLSDQTDPFNRSPLSMDQVIPQTELAEEIRSWISSKKASTS